MDIIFLGHDRSNAADVEGYLLNKRKDGKLVRTSVVKTTLTGSQNALLLNRIKQQDAQG